VSFSDEGHLSPETVEAILKTRGPVERATMPYKRYVGHQIGIYNPQGKKVGTPGHGRNREMLFLVRVAAAAATDTPAPAVGQSAPARLSS
jgi:adenine-specific DNA-methyltransferase